MNGQIKSDDVFEGLFTAEFWEYDSRIARRWNLDPVVYPMQSGHVCFNDNPIGYDDPLGLEGEKVMPGDGNKAAGTKLTAEGDVFSNGDGSVSGAAGNNICKVCGANGDDIYGLPNEDAISTTAVDNPRISNHVNSQSNTGFHQGTWNSTSLVNFSASHAKNASMDFKSKDFEPFKSKRSNSPNFEDLSFPLNVTLTIMANAAEAAADYQPLKPSAPNSKYALQTGSAANFKQLSKGLNMASGVIGTFESIKSTKVNINKGKLELADFHLLKASVYMTGTVLIFTPFAPIGVGMITTMGIIDMTEPFIKEND